MTAALWRRHNMSGKSAKQDNPLLQTKYIEEKCRKIWLLIINSVLSIICKPLVIYRPSFVILHSLVSYYHLSSDINWYHIIICYLIFIDIISMIWLILEFILA